MVLVPVPGGDGTALVGRLLADQAMELVLVVAPDVAAVAGPAPGPIAVVVSDDANGAAALELGARISFSRHRQLCLIPETNSRKLVRLAADRAEDLIRAGVDCQVPARGDGPLSEAVAESGPSLVVGGRPPTGWPGARSWPTAPRRRCSWCGRPPTTTVGGSTDGCAGATRRLLEWLWDHLGTLYG